MGPFGQLVRLLPGAHIQASQDQGSNPGLDFFAFDTFQNLVIFDDSTVTGILSSFS